MGQQARPGSNLVLMNGTMTTCGGPGLAQRMGPQQTDKVS